MSRVGPPPPLASSIVSGEMAPGQRVSLRTEDGRLLVLTVEDVTQAAAVQPSLNPDMTTEPPQHSKTVQTIGVAAAGAVIGTALAGPLIGVMAAGGAVYAASREDEVGHSTRQLGSSVVQLVERGAELAARHKLPETLSSVARTVKDKVVEISAEVTAPPADSHDSNSPYSENMRTLSAAAAVAVVGSIFTGPLLGVAAAGAVIYASTLNNSLGTATQDFGGAVLGFVDRFRDRNRSIQR